MRVVRPGTGELSLDQYGGVVLVSDPCRDSIWSHGARSQERVMTGTRGSH